MKGSRKSQRKAKLRNRQTKQAKRNGQKEYDFQISIGTKNPNVQKNTASVKVWNLRHPAKVRESSSRYYDNTHRR